MSPEGAKIKMMTVEEANALLPQVRLSLKALRETRTTVLRTQAQIEIEEMTGSDPNGKLSPGAQAAISKLMEAFHYQTRQFEEKLDELHHIGAHLKDLETGLVDFYHRRGNEIVFLCWREDENEIGHWHGLQGGFSSRRPIL